MCVTCQVPQGIQILAAPDEVVASVSVRGEEVCRRAIRSCAEASTAAAETEES